jgi:hypothetical protein
MEKLVAGLRIGRINVQMVSRNNALDFVEILTNSIPIMGLEFETSRVFEIKGIKNS